MLKVVIYCNMTCISIALGQIKFKSFRVLIRAAIARHITATLEALGDVDGKKYKDYLGGFERFLKAEWGKTELHVMPLAYLVSWLQSQGNDPACHQILETREIFLDLQNPLTWDASKVVEGIDFAADTLTTSLPDPEAVGGFIFQEMSREDKN